ncbi:MAG TPA: ABC transporter permease [Bryobacteraceae bacterium]|jgi:predicted permease|nr:ABC transporter permease [Bryobacteraceae bacterium]
MRNLPHDLRYALRALRKAPLYSTVAVLSLAFGIGANTAIFTLIHQLILQRLPVKDPQQLVMLAGRGRHYGGNNGRDKISYPMYQDIRDKNPVFSGMFSTHRETMSASFEGRTELISGELVSGNYFRVLGIGAAMGRVFTASDDLYQGGHPLAILSYGYWKARFGGDPAVLGKKIMVNGYPLTVIGVSQAGFDGAEPGYAPQIRVPMTMAGSLPPGSTFNRLNERRFRWTEVFGRLKPGMTREKAQAGLQPLFHQILEMEVQQKEFAKASPFVKREFLKMHLELMPGATGRSDLRDTYSKPLLALMAIVALVLLIACSNLANLLIARASARQKEIAVRLALGASRGRLIGQLLVESLMLSVVGGALGAALAVLIDRMLIAFLPSGSTPLSLSSTPDFGVLCFTAAVAVLAGIAFGLVPALQSTRPRLADTLKDQAAAVVHGGSVKLRKSLVVAQVALSLLLLIGAGLFLQSLGNLKYTNPGFDVHGLLSFAVEPTLNRYDKPWTFDYYRRLQDRLKAIPGIAAETLAMVPVLQDNEWDNSVTIEGYTPKQGEYPDPHMQYCATDFFRTLKIPIMLGRDFTLKDTDGAPKVGIINQKFAKRYFGSENPLGRHIGMGIDPGTKMDIEIVGVAGDTKYEDLSQEMPYELYIPYTQLDFVNGMTVYLRTQGDPVNTFNTLRRVVREVDPAVPMYDLRTLDEQLEISLFTQKLLATLSSVFGSVATLLAALGLYGVMAFMVARRTREIGIRMALGADTGSVVWMVMREVLLLASIGVAVGTAAAWAGTRLLQAQLFAIQATDLATMAAAALGIVAVAALAGYFPARRATAIDPVTALRWE